LLYVALDQEYITEAEFNVAYDLCVESARIIWGLITALRKKAGWITGLKILAVGAALGLGFSLL